MIGIVLINNETENNCDNNNKIGTVIMIAKFKITTVIKVIRKVTKDNHLKLPPEQLERNC